MDNSIGSLLDETVVQCNTKQESGSFNLPCVERGRDHTTDVLILRQMLGSIVNRHCSFP